MPAIEPLYHLFEIDHYQLTHAEKLILEIDLFRRIYDALIEQYRVQYKSYFQIMNFSRKKENMMLSGALIRNVVNDILSTEEYSIAGMALYIDVPEDVICDIASGRINEPSLQLSHKIINLHHSVRPDLYRVIIKRIISDYLTENESKLS